MTIHIHQGMMEIIVFENRIEFAISPITSYTLLLYGEFHLQLPRSQIQIQSPSIWPAYLSDCQ